MFLEALALILSFKVCVPKELEYINYSVPVPRVVNGWPAKLGDVPYQVGFKMSTRRRHFMTFCGGVIVAPAKLLSAAHCFASKKNFCSKLCGRTKGGNDGLKPTSQKPDVWTQMRCNSDVRAKTLSHTFAVAGNLKNYVNKFVTNISDIEHGQWKKLKNVVYPEKYKFPKFDIAIVFLREPFEFNNYVNSIPYASKFVDYSGKCLVSGYGRVFNNMPSDKLLVAHLELIPLYTCNQFHRRNMRMFVCTSSIPSDVRQGDSGGPLVCTNTGDPKEVGGKGILVGIVSGSRRRSGTFFTRVSSYYKYIGRNKSFKFTLHIFTILFLLNSALLLF